VQEVKFMLSCFDQKIMYKKSRRLGCPGPIYPNITVAPFINLASAVRHKRPTQDAVLINPGLRTTSSPQLLTNRLQDVGGETKEAGHASTAKLGSTTSEGSWAGGCWLGGNAG